MRVIPATVVTYARSCALFFCTGSGVAVGSRQSPIPLFSKAKESANPGAIAAAGARSVYMVMARGLDANVPQARPDDRLRIGTRNLAIPFLVLTHHPGMRI